MEPQRFTAGVVAIAINRVTVFEATMVGQKGVSPGELQERHKLSFSDAAGLYRGKDDQEIRQRLVGRSAREMPFLGISTQVGAGDNSFLEHGDV